MRPRSSTRNFWRQKAFTPKWMIWCCFANATINLIRLADGWRIYVLRFGQFQINAPNVILFSFHLIFILILGIFIPNPSFDGLRFLYPLFPLFPLISHFPLLFHTSPKRMAVGHSIRLFDALDAKRAARIRFERHMFDKRLMTK